jgi:hypothetical protein
MRGRVHGKGHGEAHSSRPATPFHTPAQGEVGQTVLYKIIYAKDATLLNKMLSDAIPHVPFIVPDDRVLMKNTQIAIQRTLDGRDENLKKIVIIWLCACYMPMQDFICKGDKNVEGMQPEDNKVVAAFFARVKTLLMEDIPRIENPFPLVVVRELLRCYNEA